jgi:hypothetical protein
MIDGPLGKKRVIDLEILPSNFPGLKSYLFSPKTLEDLKIRSTLEWLNSIDDNSILLIAKHGSFTVTELPIKIKNQYLYEIAEFTLLTLYLMKLEKTKRYVDIADLGKASVNLYYLTLAETMKRQGLLKIKGSGKISEIDTMIFPTKKGEESYEKNPSFKIKVEKLLPENIANIKDDIGFPEMGAEGLFNALSSSEEFEEVHDLKAEAMKIFNEPAVEEEIKNSSKKVEEVNKILKKKAKDKKSIKANQIKPLKKNNKIKNKVKSVKKAKK